MSIALHQIWLIITAAVLTFCSFLLLLFRRSIPGVLKYNVSFLSLFGIEFNSSSWIHYLFSWLIGTCMATVTFTLIVNINENLLLLTGLSGVLLDSSIIFLAILGIILSLLLIISALIPILGIPLTPVSALGVILLLHLFGIPYNSLSPLLSLLSVFIYFAAIAVGFVGIFLALYLFIRTFFAVPFLNRYPRKSNPSISGAKNAS
jgi:hypothetical protein